jgi:hypothetical protein
VEARQGRAEREVCVHADGPLAGHLSPSRLLALIPKPVATIVRAKLPSGSARASPPARHASRPRPSGRVPRPSSSPGRMGSIRDLDEESNSNETIKTLMISLETGAKPRDPAVPQGYPLGVATLP